MCDKNSHATEKNTELRKVQMPINSGLAAPSRLVQWRDGAAKHELN